MSTPLTPDDFRGRLGQAVATSDWVTVTQAMVNTFADATGDHQFIHVDEERARQGPFGGTVAHGFLTLSLLAGTFLTAGGFPPIQARVLLNYGLNRVRFITPVPVGARVRNHATLQAIEDGNGYVQVTVLNTIELESAPKPAVIAESIFRAYL